MKTPYIESKLFSFGCTSATPTLSGDDTTPPYPKSDRSASDGSRTAPDSEPFTPLDGSAVTIPKFGGMLPEARNGTPFTEAAAYLRSPEQGAEILARSVHRRVRSFEWKNIRKQMKELTELVSDKVNDRMNQAMQGQDAVEIFNAARDMIPALSLPKKQQVEKLFDEILDGVQKLLESDSGDITYSDTDFQGAERDFASKMGNKARKALLKQQICRQWQVTPSHANLHWQVQLTDALANIYEHNKDEYSLQTIMDMTPIWHGDRSTKTWRLIIDTGISDINEKDFTDTPIWLNTGFELPEKEGAVKITDYVRTSNPVDGGEWENIESLASSTASLITKIDNKQKVEEDMWVSTDTLRAEDDFAENVWAKE